MQLWKMMAHVSYSTKENDGERPTVKISTDNEKNASANLGEHKSLTTRRRSLRPLRKKKMKLPILFERAAKSWWNPKFDSELLESQHWRSSFPQVRQRFQYSLCYVLLTTICWCLYFAFTACDYRIALVVTSAIYAIFVIIVLAFTLTPWYRRCSFPVSLITTSVTCALSLAAFLTAVPLEDIVQDGLSEDAAGGDISTIGMFSIAVQVITLVYTFIPMPLYICVIVAGVYSISFDILSALYTRDNSPSAIVVKGLLHFAIHCIGVHVHIMTQVRMRSAFLKVGQSVLARRDLEIEKQLKEKMIRSMMPPTLVEWFMKEGPLPDDEIEDDDGTVRRLSSPRCSQSAATGETGTEYGMPSLFRPFNMNRMDNVSLVFADIVGFTKMSANKTAEQVVDLLNDLFGRFDILCEYNGCEKISTLGDCYYCLSGCPEPRADHAHCCVAMGLSMNVAVDQFNSDTHENIRVRVGVHTGSVLCGVLGSKRVKFDVWSYDVALANLMESTGRPGRVHISHPTYVLIQQDYEVEKGEKVKDMDTYFIVGIKRSFSLDSNTPLDVKESQMLGLSNPYRENKTDIKNRVIMEDVELPGSLLDTHDSSSPMLDHREDYHGRSRESWSTINSRKDSGIRSRGSSMQATHVLNMDEVNEMRPTDLLSHRVSGYYSVSQASVLDSGTHMTTLDPGASLCESLKRFHQLRKQSDMQLIHVLQHDEIHTSEYFIHPPVSKLSLSFLDADIEQEYRSRVHRQDARETTPTIASPTFNTYFDVVISQVTYIVTAFACFLMFGYNALWLVFCFLATSWQTLVATLCFKQFLNPKGSSKRLSKLYVRCTAWYQWHILGAFLVSLPMMSILTNFSCQKLIKYPLRTDFFFFTFFVSLIHFCNFTQLNCWMKSGIASLGVATVLGMLESNVCRSSTMKAVTKAISNTTNLRRKSPDRIMGSADDPFFEDESSSQVQVSFSGDDRIIYEVILDMLLLLGLIWFLNREFEISYRLSFHGSLLATRDKQKIQTLKDQADWLLYNIIPKHVADYLKTTSKYSQNHKDVGILFASISNFHEMYEESYRGGKEFLRIINELIVDFDELLQKFEFRNVEKIKTIGVSYMAASGLNPDTRTNNIHPHQQLLELMNFAFALLETTESFNRNLFEFNLILKIGYNYGSVTSGVVGTNKLYYDIWGDAVNIASRMESTGLPGNIQVPEYCVPVLEKYFEIQPRGTIYVKGKDNMNVCLVVKKKPLLFLSEESVAASVPE